MITFDEAQAYVICRVRRLDHERVLIDDALGRVLAADVTAPRDVPHEDNSAMDGFAVRHVDIRDATVSNTIRLTVIGESRAGSPFDRGVSPGEAVRIMTGALVPAGADTVVMSEYTSAAGEDVQVVQDPGKGANIRRKGEYIACGDTVLRKGETIGAAEIGILATLGYSQVQVYRQPVVAVLSTGDELVELGHALGPGQIYSSNAYSIAAQIKECGAVPLPLGAAHDDEKELIEKLRPGLSADVIVTSGGISEGRHDLVKQALIRVGMQVIFWKVAMKPGKPVLFGVLDQKPVFGLPGNPGASIICFEQFVRPALLKMMGHRRLMRPQFEAILDGQAIRGSSDRVSFLRCRLQDDNGRLLTRVIPRLGVGLHRSSLATDGLIVIASGRGLVKPGDGVTVQILRWPVSGAL